MNEPGFLYLDSDIFVLHAGAGLLPDLIAAAGFELADARRLEPLPHMLRRGSLYRRYSAAVRERTEAWCSQIPPIRQAPSAKVVDQLVRLADMDPGEALLFASAAETDPAIVATGDKRACRALSAADGLEELKALLRGKVIQTRTDIAWRSASLGEAEERALQDAVEEGRLLQRRIERAGGGPMVAGVFF